MQFDLSSAEPTLFPTKYCSYNAVVFYKKQFVFKDYYKLLYTHLQSELLNCSLGLLWGWCQEDHVKTNGRQSALWEVKGRTPRKWYIYAYTCTHVHMYTDMHTWRHSYNIHSCVYIYTYTSHAHMHIVVQTCTHIHTNLYVGTLMYAHIHIHISANTCIHSPAHSHTSTHLPSYSYKLIHTYEHS